MELETLLTISQRLEYVDAARLAPCRGLIEEISKMLTSLRRKLLAPRETN